MSKATGPDKVPVRILKETANIIESILTKIRSTQAKYQRIGKMPT
jgi:hypothetical protein